MTDKEKTIGSAPKAKGTVKKSFGTLSNKSAGRTDGLWARIQNTLVGLKEAITGK
jgi:uncharacterized protein YjbJ (UPF0337 family)